jgi:4-hydroxy-tetrahydrodipicolinate reductase
MSSSQPLRIAISGAAGRMGRLLLELGASSALFKISAALENDDNPVMGKEVPHAEGVRFTCDVPAAISDTDVLIDFTRPEATLRNVKICEEFGCPAVIGTTGLGIERNIIAESAKRIPIVFAPNMSVGVNLIFSLAGIVAATLGDEYDVEIIEAHHRNKIDAPSGTALRLGEIVAQSLGRSLEEHAIFGREGVTGGRNPKTIGFETIRAGDIVGEHTVLFAGTGERIEITHRAQDRSAFALGALKAAKWVHSRQNGLFDMMDVLELTPRQG